MSRIIGITGGIGAGKSVVSRLLRLRGYRVYDCDTEAKRLMEEDEELRERLMEILGEGAYQGKHLDKGVVAKKIFGDDRLRGEVNHCVHKAVREDFKRFSERVGDTVFVESAILKTGGFIPTVDEIWLLDAPEELRIERVKKRNGLTEDEIRSRIATQKSEFADLPAGKTKVLQNTDEESLLLQCRKLLGDSDESQEEELIIDNNNQQK